jgi:hypothetical protein
MTANDPSPDLVETFRSALRSSIDAQQDVAQERVAALQDELQVLSRRLVTLDRQLLAHTRRRALLCDLQDRVASAEEELRRILAVRGVQSIEVVDRTLHVVTDPVQIEWEGVRYCLGNYRLVLNLDGDVHVQSVSKLGPKSAWGHPHVQDGRPCLGNLREGMLKLIAEYELALAVQVALQFLESYQPESAYCAIERWPRADAEG